MNLNDFQQFLTNFQQNDNEIIQKSTEIYQLALSENISGIITLHFQNILSFASPNLVAMSIILLKRAFIPNDSSNLLNGLKEETIGFISTTLPDLFLNENLTPHLFSLLVDTASLIATFLMKKNYMLDFIPKLVKIVKMMSPIFSPPAMNCIVQCNNYNPLVNFELKEDGHIIISLGDVYSIIEIALTNGFSIDFTISALRMLFSFYNQMKQLSEFAPAISEIYSKLPSEQLIIALSDLSIFLEENDNVIYFAQTLPILMQSLLSIVTNNNNGDNNSIRIQTIVINIFTRLAKHFDVEFNPFLIEVTKSVLIASCHFPEEASDDIDSNAPYSDLAIFILSEIFSSRTTYPSLVLTFAKEMIQRNEWNCRRSGISAIHKLLLSCETGLDTYLDDILSIIKDHFTDPNYICRFYSFCALSELCESYSIFLNQYAQILIPLIVSILKAENSHEVKVIELKSIESICKYSSSESILPMAQPLIGELLPQIQDPETTPIEQLTILKCISTITLATGINFDQFYPSSMGWLKTAMSQISPGTENLIRIETIKTIPLIGRTVDLQLFQVDAVEFMNSLLQNDFSTIGEDEKKSILFAMKEMSEILPREIFFQFLPLIFNLLGTTISTEFEEEVFPLTYDMSSLTDRIKTASRDSNSIVTYSRSQLSLYSDCIDVMIKLIETLKEITIPFIRPISKVVAKFIGFSSYPPLQISSIRLYNSLINLYREHDAQVLSLFLPYVKKILFPIVSNLLQNSTNIIRECFDLLANAIGDQFNEDFLILVNNIFIQLRLKRNMTIQKGQTENAPDLLLLDELEISIENFVKILLQKFPQNMIQFYPELLHSRCLIFNLLFMTDLYQVSLSNSSNIIDLSQLINLIFESINSSRMNLSYAAFISLSKIIQVIPIDQNLITQSIDKIILIFHEYEEDEDNSTQKAVDGAIITLSAIIKIAYGKIDLSSIIQVWFKQMPILLDSSDSNIAFEVLCILVNDKNPQVLNSSSISQLLHCCSAAIKKKNISNEIRNQIIFITKELCTNDELHDLVQEAVSSLNVEDRKHIQNVII